MNRPFFILMTFSAATATATAACSDTAGPRATGASSSGTIPPTNGADGGTTPEDVFNTGTELRIPVPETGRVYVKLNPPAVLSAPPADPKNSPDWDLAFEGFDIFTNSGISGNAKAGAFGPIDAVTFFGDTTPQVPFLSIDEAGGAFLSWYAYEGESHALYSRYHIYGVKDGDRLFKVQVLSYYSERDGAAISALYKIRYAELTATGAGPMQEPAPPLDGTAGGAASPATSQSECIDLGTNTRTMLNPAERVQSQAWHLCFRRDSISVNGETGGPRGVTAVDLEADLTASETITTVSQLTADSKKASFDQATAASFDGKTFRGDRVVSAFNDRWYDASKTAPAKNTAWVVRDAGGTQKHLLGFTQFQIPTTKSPGTVVMRTKPVKG